MLNFSLDCCCILSLDFDRWFYYYSFNADHIRNSIPVKCSHSISGFLSDFSPHSQLKHSRLKNSCYYCKCVTRLQIIPYRDRFHIIICFIMQIESWLVMALWEQNNNDLSQMFEKYSKKNDDYKNVEIEIKMIFKFTISAYQRVNFSLCVLLCTQLWFVFAKRECLVSGMFVFRPFLLSYSFFFFFLLFRLSSLLPSSCLFHVLFMFLRCYCFQSLYFCWNWFNWISRVEDANTANSWGFSFKSRDTIWTASTLCVIQSLVAHSFVQSFLIIEK